jgi:hypothetical protein
LIYSHYIEPIACAFWRAAESEVGEGGCIRGGCRVLLVTAYAAQNTMKKKVTLKPYATKAHLSVIIVVLHQKV